MTLLDERPAEVLASERSGDWDRPRLSRWRLASRLARREVRRRPGRTVLAALLIAVPAAAMTLGSIAVRTDAAGEADGWRFRMQYGDADVVRSLYPLQPGDPEEFAPAPVPPLPAGTHAVEFIAFSTQAINADLALGGHYAVFTNAPLDDRLVASSLDLRDGSVPAPGEVLIGPQIAEDWGLSVGDRLELSRPSGSWRVAGIGLLGASSDMGDVLAIPGFDTERIVPYRRATVELYDLPDETSQAELTRFSNSFGGLNQFNSGYTFYDEGRMLAWGWVGGALALVAVGIIVAAAFATSARRQLVTVGQLSSNGAPHGIVRATLALQGTWTGIAGAVLGVGGALVSLPLWRDLFVGWQGPLPGSVIAAGDLIAVAVTAIVAGTVAAAVPARALARTPVMAALSGRRPLGTPPRRLVPIGLALFGGGMALLTIAGRGARNGGGGDPNMWAAVVTVGAVGVVFGTVCATPLAVAFAGRLAGRMPLSIRLGLRSMARSRTRSAAVVAAIAVATGGAVAGATIVEQAISRTGYGAAVYMPADSLTIERYDNVTCCDTGFDPELLEPTELDADQMALLERTLPGASIEPLLIASFDPPPFDPLDQSGTSYSEGRGPLVVTPATEHLFGLDPIDAETLHRDGELAAYSDPTSVASDVQPSFTYPTETGTIDVSPELAQRPSRYYYGEGSLLVTPQRAEQLGFTLVERGVVVRTPEALTSPQRSALQRSFGSGYVDLAFQEPGDPVMTDEMAQYTPTLPTWSLNVDYPDWRDNSTDLWLVRAGIFGAALLLIGLVVAIGLALAAAEGRDERDVLAVVGARPSSLRRQAAARAAVLATTGVVLGIPTGYLPAKVLGETLQVDGWNEPDYRFPWLLVGALVFVMPVIVAGVTWAGSGIASRIHPVRPARRD